MKDTAPSISSENTINRLINGAKEALPGGLRTSLWLIKLTLPISFAVLLLDHYGLLILLAQYTSPLFELVGLPGIAAIVLITSIFTNMYAVLAVMTTLALPVRDGTILALMCLVSHGFPLETTILRKTGSSAMRMLLLRIFSSFILAAVLNLILPGNISTTHYQYISEQHSLSTAIILWLPQIGVTLLRILLIVNTLLILQRWLEDFGILQYLTKPLIPIMKMMGLPPKASFLWTIGNIVGLSYGSAIMLQKSEEGLLSKKECDLLNHHLAVSHSQLEDPLIFLALGYPVHLLIIPRVLWAIIIVWLRRLELRLKSR